MPDTNETDGHGARASMLILYMQTASGTLSSSYRHDIIRREPPDARRPALSAASQIGKATAQHALRSPSSWTGSEM
eukprot:5341531-Pleurochrysis_carterae.AAC.4